MSEATPLDLLRRRTAALVEQDLRSQSVVIARLCESIDEAVRLGHSHRSILRAIANGGLAISPTNYRIALARARKAARGVRRADDTGLAGLDGPVGLSDMAAAGGVAPELELARAPAIGPDATPRAPCSVSSDSPDAASGTSTATSVLDALRHAREVAARDYRRIATDNYRQSLRKSTPKDPP